MRDQELILRFLALLLQEARYTRPMKTFLNKFMDSQREIDDALSTKLSKSFENAISLIHDAIGTKAFKPVGSFNAAVFDAVSIGVARRLDDRALIDYAGLQDAYSRVITDKNFLLWTSRSTADDETVRKRLELARVAFAEIS